MVHNNYKEGERFVYRLNHMVWLPYDNYFADAKNSTLHSYYSLIIITNMLKHSTYKLHMLIQINGYITEIYEIIYMFLFKYYFCVISFEKIFACDCMLK